LLWILPGNLHGIQRGIDDPNIAALAPHAEQVFLASRHPQHVAEGTKDHARLGRNGERLIDDFERGHADGAAWAVDHRDFGRQELIDAVADDGVGLPAADLHDLPGPRGEAANLAGQLLCNLAVAELIQILHGWPSWAASDFARTQFLVQQAHFAKAPQRLLGRSLVDFRDGEAHMHDRVIADRNLGHVREADILHDATEIHLAHAREAVTVDRVHPSRDREASGTPSAAKRTGIDCSRSGSGCHFPIIP
jgi:hypothetical protein